MPIGGSALSKYLHGQCESEAIGAAGSHALSSAAPPPRAFCLFKRCVFL
jgi:hypothetical protein